ncbi:hypothetical protein ATJ97_0289 [Georgenia soli]|uniref:Uncharacterized protein n=1 Tax=Georgenia soli TaxID=638953 RepID=A0A2A9F1G7_9MICO|nr:hypothetical protein [Georgenia soli]PFG44868.1 hypothetical protein ATJ97_0140 [Georgenia soli]PFG45008.1 hypothetical protein ATJ97_0289 [Georgenia soli]
MSVQLWLVLVLVCVLYVGLAVWVVSAIFPARRQRHRPQAAPTPRLPQGARR